MATSIHALHRHRSEYPAGSAARRHRRQPRAPERTGGTPGNSAAEGRKRPAQQPPGPALELHRARGRAREVGAPALRAPPLDADRAPAAAARPGSPSRSPPRPSDRFPDGAWWVELAPLADERLVGAAIAAALGVRPLPGVTELQAAGAYLASRRALVVLDNCEHLLGGVRRGGRGAPQAAARGRGPGDEPGAARRSPARPSGGCRRCRCPDGARREAVGRWPAPTPWRCSSSGRAKARPELRAHRRERRRGGRDLHRARRAAAGDRARGRPGADALGRADRNAASRTASAC